jgi:hypothetical protein
MMEWIRQYAKEIVIYGHLMKYACGVSGQKVCDIFGEKKTLPRILFWTIC